jgi:hypothetical protein
MSLLSREMSEALVSFMAEQSADAMTRWSGVIWVKL